MTAALHSEGAEYGGEHDGDEVDDCFSVDFLHGNDKFTIAKDVEEHYARQSGEGMEPNSGITEDEWLRKAMEMGVRDVRWEKKK